MPKISIIVPCYNVAEYLPRCLDALLAQTYQDWQAICVDDGSTDNTYDILKQYAEKDRRIIAIHQENHGVEWARATAMEHIDSPYIMFCDPDDWYEPEMCEKMITTLERENVDIVMCGTNIVGMEDYDMQKYFANMPDEGKYSASFEMISKYNMVLWNRIYKKETLDKYEIDFPKDDKIRRGYDVRFVMKYILCIDSIYFIHDRLYNYFQREDSLVHSFNTGKSKNKFDVWYGFEYILNFMKQNNLYDKYKKIIFTWFNNRFPWLISKVSDDSKKHAVGIIEKILIPYKSDITKKEKWLYAVLNWKKEKLYKKILDCYEIKLVFFNIYKRIKEQKNKKVFLFGIPVFEKIKQNSNKEIYLGKWRIYRRKKK